MDRQSGVRPTPGRRSQRARQLVRWRTAAHAGESAGQRMVWGRAVIKSSWYSCRESASGTGADGAGNEGPDAPTRFAAVDPGYGPTVGTVLRGARPAAVRSFRCGWTAVV